MRLLTAGNVSRAGDSPPSPWSGTVLAVNALDYELPEDRIARTPADRRDAARLLVVSRSGPQLDHEHISDLPGLLRAGDLLVVNASRVIPARLLGERADTKGGVEGLFLGAEGGRWRIMLKGRRMKPGIEVNLFDRAGERSGTWLRLIERSGEEGEEGAWVAEVMGMKPGEDAMGVLERVGTTPLPPYIRAARKRHHEEVGEERDRERYQTVYAGVAAGSVAAPTAGLHFTPELLAALEAAGIALAEVELHVGTGTFKSMETEFVEQHPMHAEWCRVPAATGEAIAKCRASGGRVFAVGTTAARTLESFLSEELRAGGEKWTKILITPGYAWRNVDGLLTNFHLPRSTLMAMVGALLGEDGVERLKAIYSTAIAERYRFYSYGDAMLVLP